MACPMPVPLHGFEERLRKAGANGTHMYALLRNQAPEMDGIADAQGSGGQRVDFLCRPLIPQVHG